MGENLWIVKHKRGSKLNYRVELELEKQQFVVYSKKRPGKHAREFVSLENKNATLFVTNKECYTHLDHQLAPQLFYGEVPSGCVILQSYEDTGNNYTFFATEITTIKNKLIVIPYNITSTMLGEVLDSGINLNHCFFYDKDPTHFYTYANGVLPEISDSYHEKVAAYIRHQNSDFLDGLSGHGTHVAGIAVGSTCFARKGIAPNSRIVFIDLGNSQGSLYLPYNLLPIFGALNNKASSSSWGSLTKTYDSVTAQFDHFVKNVRRDYIHFVACGNNCPPGYVSSPALLWNGISIGAVDDNGNIAPFSCKAIDGRLYPLIYLPGVGVISAYSESNDVLHFGFVSKSGTSMATPVALGLFYYIDSRYLELGIHKASNALIRATYVANAEHPSRILLSFKNDFFTNSKKWLLLDEERVASQSNYKKCFYLPKGADLKVVLAWIEPPSANLINDLDVMVRIREKSIWGNHGLTSDTINNNEIIYVNEKNEDRAISVIVSDTAASLTLFSLVVTSSQELIPMQCNETCTMLEPPIECDYDEVGNAGYYTCKADGTLDRTLCKFHECDIVPMSALVNKSCTAFNKTANVVKNNGYYIDEYLHKCREQCYLEGDACVCPYGIANLVPSPPPHASTPSGGTLLKIQVGQVLFLFAILYL